MTQTMTLTKTQASTLEAIRNLPADAPHGLVRPGVSYAGVKAYKGVNASAVHALLAKGLLVRAADGTVSAA